MDNFRYNSLDNFEIFDSPKGYIPCDKEIADIVAILNRKGYKTVASCAGHNVIVYDMENKIRDIGELDRIKENPDFKIYDITDDKIYVKNEIIGASTYIVFEENYIFDELPDNFIYKDKWLGKMIDYYNENMTSRRRDYDIDDELKNNWCALRKWANELKYNNQRGNN